MNRLAKRDLIIGVVIMAVFSPILIHGTFLQTPSLIPYLASFPVALGMGFFFCAVIKRNQNEYEYVHGVRD